MDETGARHQGEKGYTIQLGNEYFAWFETTETKDRITFLSVLQGGEPSYVLNAPAWEYIQAQQLPKGPLERLKNTPSIAFEETGQGQAHLRDLAITPKRPIRLATEGALLGGLLQGGVSEALAIVSDDAGQFNILNHGRGFGACGTPHSQAHSAQRASPRRSTSAPNSGLGLLCGPEEV